MWLLSLAHRDALHIQTSLEAPRDARWPAPPKRALAALTLIASPAISTGEVRPIIAWNFARDEPRRGPKLSPHTEHTLTYHDKEVRARTFWLKKEGVYLADSADDADQRVFCYLVLRAEEVTPLTREQVAHHFFPTLGVEALDAALTDHDWTLAWKVAALAPDTERAALQQRCIEAVRAALREAPLAELDASPAQLPWAAALREQATQQVRATWRNLSASPALVAAHPRLRYALITCAFALRTQQSAARLIALDYHLARAHVHELLDHFSALGKKSRATPGERAYPLTPEELATLSNLSASVRP